MNSFFAKHSVFLFLFSSLFFYDNPIRFYARTLAKNTNRSVDFVLQRVARLETTMARVARRIGVKIAKEQRSGAVDRWQSCNREGHDDVRDRRVFYRPRKIERPLRTLHSNDEIIPVVARCFTPIRGSV